MDGAHAMSMAWAPGAGAGAGETWLGAAVAFLFRAGAFEVGWIAMMAIMMLPSLVPALRRYWRAVREVPRSRAIGAGALTVSVGAAYLAVWGALGAAVYVGGSAVALACANWPQLGRLTPFVAGTVVLLGGALQLSRWKARRLACCREARERRRVRPATARTAWRHGLALGVDCVQSCAPLTAILLAVGMMDLRAMAAVTGAITAERLAPAGERVARWVGGVGVCAGLLLVARGYWA